MEMHNKPSRFFVINLFQSDLSVSFQFSYVLLCVIFQKNNEDYGNKNKKNVWKSSEDVKSF